MAWKGDLLERQVVAKFLQNLIESDDDIKVVNIDSAWGTGKTFFLNNWKEELKGQRGVVYFNAWENDYTGDPFVSIVSSVKKQLEKQVGSSEAIKNKFNEFSNKASRAIVSVAPVIIKEVARGVVKKISGVDAGELTNAIEGASNKDGSYLEDVTSAAMSVADEVAIKAVITLIETNENNKLEVEGFRDVFKDLVNKVSKEVSPTEQSTPIYIFIDELDRCRPTYAIELLERVKHFLDVPGCKFVIATDTEQLCHSVKAVYGSGFNSFEYLKRFFDLTYTLDNSDLRSWVKAKAVFKPQLQLSCLHTAVKENTQSWMSYDNQVVIRPDERTIISNDKDLNVEQVVLLALCKTFSISLRELEKLLLHMKAVLSNIINEVEFIFLAYLVFLKSVNPVLYRRFVEDQGVRSILDESYPPYKLYMTYECVSVHELAAEYLNASKMTSRERMDEINANPNTISFKTEIYQRDLGRRF